MFRLFRFFAIASLFVLGLGALLLSTLYRQSALQDLMRVEQDKNVALTRSFANTLWPEFATLIGASTTLSSAELRNNPALLALDAQLWQQMAGLNIVRVKIYELSGRTLYSSELEQIGENQARNPGLLAAARGEIVNELTHRDEFNALDGVIENRDVLASYLPLRRTPDAEVEAVFELYSDVTSLLDEINRVQWRISVSVLFILGILYAALLSVVLYGEHIVRQQYGERVRAESALRSQNNYLATLYATALNVLDRQNLDATLREILTQTSQIVQAAHGVIVLCRTQQHPEVVAGTGVFAASSGASIVLARTIAESAFTQDKLRVYDQSVIGACQWGAPIPTDLLLIAIPLLSRQRVCGLFLLFAPPAGNEFSQEATDLLAGYVQVAALAIDNFSLYQDLQAELAERMRTERILAASEERMRALVQSMRDVVFTVDLSGRYTGFYGRAIEEYGLLSSSTVGKTPADIFEPNTAQLHAEAIQRALENENVVFDWEVTTPDERKVYLQTSLSPVLNRAGVLSGLVGVGRDYSELKRLQQLRTEFIANVSHELRTPLASILGYTEIILQERPGALNGIQREFLQTIFDNSRRLKRLVDDLLDVSKIEVGKFRLQFAETDLIACVQVALEAIRPIATRSDVRIDAALPSALPMILADAQRIGQVLDNLLSNAVKYNEAGGRVDVCVAQAEKVVTITVANSGVGIAPEDLPHLFTRFYRSTNAASNRRTGAGLGLYITRAIIDGHGGRIEVTSEPGKGCTFQIWLPIQPENLSSPAPI